MREVIAGLLIRLQYVSSIMIALFFLSACGGGGGGNNQFSDSTSQITITSSISSSAPESSSISSSSSLTSISSVASSISSSASTTDTVTLSGTVTYDYVPHNLNHVGLNYSAVEQRPVRGAVVDLLDDIGQIKASTNTASDGTYAFTLQKNSMAKIRVKAQLLNSLSPTWNFKVTDNTSNNALYVLDGALATTGTQNSKRNLNAGSGWDGVSYSAQRAAAPFAILDNIYIAANLTITAVNKKNLSPLELRWSTKNSAADGDSSRGEIGTSFYDGTAIYILGDANNDTDEYDPHVLLHEWGHYLEAELFRSDSIGGDHSDGQLLDLRVAMSEGFANAFSGMMINDINYADASGAAQASGFSFSIGRKSRINKGFFSEGSIGSVLYNYYTNATNKTANDFTPIFNVLSSVSYTDSEAFTSIFLFFYQFKNQLPEHTALFSNLLQEQDIFGTDEYGSDESNNGGLAITLPIYKTLTTSNLPVNVCSAADYGKQNKLGNAQFLKLNISQAGTYNIRINKSGGADVISKPEFIVYQKGVALSYVPNSITDSVSGNVVLLRGNYIIEVYDFNNYDSKNTDENMTCFNVRVTAN
jgi:hypothetical protein